MAESIKRGKLLVGASEIMCYLQCSWPLFQTFLHEGMPAAKICGRWYAHVDNIDEFFRRKTFSQHHKITETDMQEGG